MYRAYVSLVNTHFNGTVLRRVGVCVRRLTRARPSGTARALVGRAGTFVGRRCSAGKAKPAEEPPGRAAPLARPPSRGRPRVRLVAQLYQFGADPEAGRGAAWPGSSASSALVPRPARAPPGRVAPPVWQRIPRSVGRRRLSRHRRGGRHPVRRHGEKPPTPGEFAILDNALCAIAPCRGRQSARRLSHFDRDNRNTGTYPPKTLI